MSDVECFSEATKNVRGVARIFPWGGPKYRFQNLGKCNLGEYPLPLPPPLGSGYFPNYQNGYVPLNRVMILECFRSGTAKLDLSCCVSTCLLLLDVWVKP